MGAIKIILWDVYGTLIAAERGDLESLVRRSPELRRAFEQTVANFRLRLPAAKLHELFLGCLRAETESRRAQRIAHPEIRVDEIWYRILETTTPSEPPTINHARDVALFFERHANPKRLMPGAFGTLLNLHQRGIRQGIISNAQFYTRIELSELLRDESEGAVCGLERLFAPELCSFSYELGVSKPDLTAFERTLGKIKIAGVNPTECLMVGDSFANDVATAQRVGMRAAWFNPTAQPLPADANPPDFELRTLSQLERLLA